jgi:tRNA A-37 threonylcarbamoyl transferase component Bud32
MPMLLICLRLYTLIKRTALKYYFAEKKIQYWRQNRELLLSLADKGYKTRVEQLGLDWVKITSSENSRQQSHKVELGEIDQDGFLLSKVGKISNMPNVSKKQFLVRKRFGLRLVAIDGYVCIEKHYKGNKFSFVNEIEAHYHLGRAGCNMPVIMDADFDNLTLTFSYISGRVLREELAGRGAIVRDRDIEENPELTRSGKRKKAINRVLEGRRVLSEVIDSPFIELIFAELDKIHEARFIWNDIKYGNIIIEEQSGKPYLIDFDWALCFQELGENAFRILRDRDVEKFNACFGTEKLTYKRIKHNSDHGKRNETCTPINFVPGLESSIKNTNDGYGHFEQKFSPVNNRQN